MNKNYEVTLNVSARHVHLKKEHLDSLFGKNYVLTKLKDLYQPGEFASEEQVTLEANGRRFEHVRILGPLRPYSQIEISKTDARSLKINPPIRTSGDLKGSSPIKLIGPKGEIELDEGCIIANRHIHLSTEEAGEFGVSDNDIAEVEVLTEKGAILKDVHFKVKDTYRKEMHIDTDDGNALAMQGGQLGTIIKIN